MSNFLPFPRKKTEGDCGRRYVQASNIIDIQSYQLDGISFWSKCEHRSIETCLLSISVLL